MNQSLEKLEINVYQLVQKFETQLGENKRHQEEIARLKSEIARHQMAQEQQKNEHQAAVDELSEALMVQMSNLKNEMQNRIQTITDEMQNKIDELTAENQKYRDALNANAEHLRKLLSRLPQQPEATQQEGC